MRINIFILTTLIFIGGLYGYNTFFTDSHNVKLAKAMNKVEVQLDNERETFKKKSELSFDRFVDLKNEYNSLQCKIDFYQVNQDSPEEGECNPDQFSEENKKEIIRVFSELVAKHNGVDVEAFNIELSNLVKMPSGIQAVRSTECVQEPLKEKIEQFKQKIKIKVLIYETCRSNERQQHLWEQGRVNGGSIVTYARPGESNHNHGAAFDVVCLVNDQPNWKECDWAHIGEVGKSLGLEWGGDWKFSDKPHFELKYNEWVDHKDQARSALDNIQRAERHKIIQDYVCNRILGVKNNFNDSLDYLCFNSKMFTEAADKHGVHPYLLVAIAVADTSMGKHLKTTYNIGNWGNVDSGATVSLSSWEEGVDKMASAKAIRMSSKLGHLTPTCNMGGVNYATSPVNWHRNVSSVLSKLHGYQVGCNYEYKS